MSFRRLLLIEVFLFLFAAAIIGRLFYWQVLKHEGFVVAAKEQTETTIYVGAQRGKILASDGSVLVSNQKAYLVYAILPEVKKLQEKDESYDNLVKGLVDTLTPILLEERLVGKEDLDQQEKDKIRLDIKETIDSELRLPNLVWVPIAKKVSEATKQKIEKLKIKGIGFEDDSERFYPEKDLAAALLGFVGKDDQGSDKGYFGLEGYYDEKLHGRSGRLVQEIDALGKPILAADPEGLGALDGASLLTTLDRTVQFVVDKKLKEAVKRFGAKGGVVVVIDPKTGALLADSSYPSFNPLDFEEYKAEDYKNLAISEVYEPGSTFKVITSAAALDTGAVDTSTVCPCEGPIRIGEYEIQTWNNKYNPNSTIVKILQNSDNVGAAFMAKKTGIDSFLKYVKKFGFGIPAGIDLQGEEAGIVKERKNWNELELVTASFGQGLSATPLQMVDALAVVANGGKLMRPYVVKKIIGPKGEVEIKPKQIGEVIKPETADTLKQLLLAAVEGSGNDRWILSGYRIAGKTGTAQVAIGGHYSGKTVSSFIGFGPVEDPRFAMAVVLFEPSASIWAVETTEPLFFEIAKELYPYWGIPVHQ